MRAIAQGGSSPTRNGGISSGRRPGQRQTPANRIRGDGIDMVDCFGVEPGAAEVRIGRGGVTTDAHRAQDLGRRVVRSRDEADGAGDIGGDERRRDGEGTSAA